MQFSTQNVRTISATVIAVALVAAAFWFSNPNTPLASALSTDELLRAYVEQDTDADGLPDWQEEVYETDPANAHSVDPTLTDSEAVAEGLVAPAILSEPVPDPVTDADIPVPAPAADSLTERFSRQFIEAYFAAGGGTNVSEEEQQQIIEGLISTFARESENLLDSPYTRVSLHVTKELDERTYIGSVENLIKASLPQGDTDMPGLANRLIEKKDASAGTRLGELGEEYSGLAKELLALPVPSSLADAHLSLVHAYDRVGRAGNALSRYEEDPIAALGALSVFIPAHDDIVAAFSAYAVVVLREGEPAPGEPGDLSVQFARSKEQQ